MNTEIADCYFRDRDPSKVRKWKSFIFITFPTTRRDAYHLVAQTRPRVTKKAEEKKRKLFR